MKHLPVAGLNEGSTAASVRPIPSTPKRIWIDLDNSPHVPFFAPIMEELRKRGYVITLTARDAYQVCELADLFGFSYKRVGHHWGKHRLMKILGTCLRTLQLLPIVWRAKPDLAVAHGSRSQIMASVLLRIPSLSIFDYEFTSAAGFFRPTWGMTPEVIPFDEHTRRTLRILQYPGIKEDVYVPQFKPDPLITSRLGLNKDSVIVVVRPPASEAHYHNPLSDELFAATIEFLSREPSVQVIVLPRNKRQGSAVREAWPVLFASGQLSIPDHAEDGLNLMWHSDLVISGGGTMNREAAALGVPVYSIFRGTIGAVDRYLANTGRLVLIESVEDLRSKIVLTRRSRPSTPDSAPRPALRKIVDSLIMLSESK